MQYETIEQVKAANRAAGYHFFDADTMRSFRSRIGEQVYGGHYFITSEQFVGGYPHYHVAERLYTVRYALNNGQIGDAGPFNVWTRAQCVRAIRGYLDQEQAQGYATYTCDTCNGEGVTHYPVNVPEGQRETSLC